MSEPIVETQEWPPRFGARAGVDHVNFICATANCVLIGQSRRQEYVLQIDHRPFAALMRWPCTDPRQYVTGWSTHQIVRARHRHQDAGPLGDERFTVTENLWLSARRTAGHEEVDAAVEEVVAELHSAASPPSRRRARARRRQLVEIGAVLANKPWLVLLGEPAAGLTDAETDTADRHYQAHQ